METLVGSLTNDARTYFGDMTIGGRSFIVESFVTGSSGHEPSEPSLAAGIDCSVKVLPQLTFGPKALKEKLNIASRTKAYVIYLDSVEAVGPLSSFGLIARFNYSEIPNDPLLNTTFLYAIAHMPIQSKLAGEKRAYTIVINY